MLAKMRHQRRKTAAEQSFQDAFALEREPLVALENRRVEIAPMILRGFYRTLAQQASSRVFTVVSCQACCLPNALITSSLLLGPPWRHKTSMTSDSASLMGITLATVDSTTAVTTAKFTRVVTGVKHRACPAGPERGQRIGKRVPAGSRDRCHPRGHSWSVRTARSPAAGRRHRGFSPGPIRPGSKAPSRSAQERRHVATQGAVDLVVLGCSSRSIQEGLRNIAVQTLTLRPVGVARDGSVLPDSGDWRPAGAAGAAHAPHESCNSNSSCSRFPRQARQVATSSASSRAPLIHSSSSSTRRSFSQWLMALSKGSVVAAVARAGPASFFRGGFRTYRSLAHAHSPCRRAVGVAGTDHPRTAPCGCGRYSSGVHSAYVRALTETMSSWHA